MTAAVRHGRCARVFSFPDPVNEVAARLVAAGVALLCVATIATGQAWLTAVIAYGFLARVLSGPTLSPMGQLATRVLAPRLPFAPRPVSGPPKRFAQTLGLLVSGTAVLLALVVGSMPAADGVLGALIVAASLEAGLGLCPGCTAFGILMRAGVIPDAVCERCNDIRLRAPEAANPPPPAGRWASSPRPDA